MTTVAVKKPMTLAEFERLPVGPPYVEFEEGELIPVPSPTPDHQDVVDALVQVVRQFVRQHDLGRLFREVDVYLPDGRVYVPDLCFLAADRLNLLSPIDRKIHGAPDLAVEVISSDTGRDRVVKFRIYHANGVPWYWIVDPDSLSIEEYHATPEGYVRVSSIAAGETFTPRLFPGLSLDLAALLGLTPPPPASEE